MLSCSPRVPGTVRVLKEKSCGSCVMTFGSFRSNFGSFRSIDNGCLLKRRGFVDTFFGDQILFLNSLHANLISQYLVGSLLASLCSFVGWSVFSVKIDQKRYKRRFHTIGIR